MESNNPKHFSETKVYGDLYLYENNDQKAFCQEEQYELTLNPSGSATLFYKIREFIETEAAAECNWEETLFKGNYIILARSAQEATVSLTFSSKDFLSKVEYTNHIAEQYKDKDCEPVFFYAYVCEDGKSSKAAFSENLKFRFLKNANKQGTFAFQKDLETLRMFRAETEEASFSALCALNSKNNLTENPLADYIISEIKEHDLAECFARYERLIKEFFANNEQNSELTDKARLLALLARGSANIYALKASLHPAYSKQREFFISSGFTNEEKIVAIFKHYEKDFWHFNYSVKELSELGIDKIAVFEYAAEAAAASRAIDWTAFEAHFLSPLLSEKERHLTHTFKVPVDAHNYAYIKEYGIYKAFLHVLHPKVEKMSANFGVENFAYFYLDDKENNFKKPEKFLDFISHLRKEFKEKQINITEAQLLRIAAEMPKGKKAQALDYYLNKRKESLMQAETIVKNFPLFDEVYIVKLLNEFGGNVDDVVKILKN